MWKFGNKFNLKEYRNSEVTISPKIDQWSISVIEILDSRIIEKITTNELIVRSIEKLNKWTWDKQLNLPLISVRVLYRNSKSVIGIRKIKVTIKGSRNWKRQQINRIGKIHCLI
jgi:hypothetical protein